MKIDQSKISTIFQNMNVKLDSLELSQFSNYIISMRHPPDFIVDFHGAVPNEVLASISWVILDYFYVNNEWCFSSFYLNNLSDFYIKMSVDNSVDVFLYAIWGFEKNQHISINYKSKFNQLSFVVNEFLIGVSVHNIKLNNLSSPVCVEDAIFLYLLYPYNKEAVFAVVPNDEEIEILTRNQLI